MIVGSGLLAQAFTQYYAENPDVLIFASGVSNSSVGDTSSFQRERQMLKNALLEEKKVVYFSTCSIFDPGMLNVPYVVHKREMEAVIEQSTSYVIFRLPQVVGKSPNPHTLTNFINSHILTGQHFEIWRHAYRNLIDVSDIALIAKAILENEIFNNQTINIAAPNSLPILEIVKIFEKVLGKKAQYSMVDKGRPYSIDASHAVKFANRAGVDFSGNYPERVIRKYYAEQ